MWWGKGVIENCETEFDLHVETIGDISNVCKNDDAIQVIGKMEILFPHTLHGI